jgi:hypothetical protein
MEEPIVDKYKQLMCVKGLILSLDEQLYRGDQFKKDGLNFDKTTINEYYEAIINFLDNHEGTDEKT